MNSRRTGFSLAAIAAILLLLSTLPGAFAQDRDDRDYDQDPPARAGRVSYTHGSVSFQPGGEGDWLDAVPNRPLTTGDNLWADRDARAEMQIGSTSIRLGAETSVTLLDLQSNVTQLRLSMGSLFFRVRHVGSDDTFEVDTPNLAFNVTEPGEYRIDVNGNGDQTTATVWHGDAEITGGGSSYRLTEGQQGTFSGVDQLRYDVGEIGREDDFSRWCMDRDRREDHIRSSQYVSAEMTGYEDLDDYGRWHYVPTYGYVWTPVGVPYGWAPYRYGHWVYVAPWGWTWVEDEPWGFAPFHYGRWAFVGGGWCWVPGPVAVVPVYSPALVAFVGGGGFSIGVGFGGGVGWFPLAPGEVYVPWYRTSPHYVERVNITNTHVTNVQVTNVYNNVTVNHVTNVTYVNQQTNAVTVVNRQTFINAQPVHNNMIRVDAHEIQRAPVTHEVVQNIQPQRQSVMGTARQVNYAPPTPVMARPVIATRQPVLVNRIAPAPGVSRVAAMPPIRTVEAAPRGHSELLRPGARGTTPGMANAPVSRPAPENNRGAAPTFGGPARPNMPENNPGRPTANTPRPGAPQNAPMTPQRGEVGNPRGPENYPGNRPNAPEVNRPAAPQYNPPAAQAPENNRPMREVPRPPSARPEQPQGRPERPQERPEQPQQARPAQPMPQQNPEPQRSNAPYARPSAPENPRNAPQPANPTYRPAPPEQRHEQPAPPEMRREPAPQPQATRPEPAPRAPEMRREPAPQPQATRPEPPRQQEVRPMPAPEPRHEAAPVMRNEPAPRPPETHSAPPPQHESRPQNEKGGNQDRGHEKDKEPPKFR